MTQLTSNPAYQSIASRIDAVGRRYRLALILRGLMLWITAALVASVAAALTAHLLGNGQATILIASLWIAWLIVSAILWLAIPILPSPRRIQIARMIESQFADLNNGLTNSLLFVESPTLATNPFLPRIFTEVLRDIEQKPLKETVRLSDLRSPAIRMLIVLAATAIAAWFFAPEFTHGWRQMLTPNQFIPQSGPVRIVSVEPGDITLVAGQSLHLIVTAIAPSSTHPPGKLIFDAAAPIPLIAHPNPGASLRYEYTLDHVDQSTRYRVEIGSTQSPWYTVTVVTQIKLIGMTLHMTPPSYTRQPSLDLSGAGPYEFPQGSQVQISMEYTPPTAGHLTRSLKVLADATFSADITQGAQVIGRLPDPPLVIRAQIDQPPAIKAIWPDRPEIVLPPTHDLIVIADLSDDWGLTAARVLLGIGDHPLTLAAEATDLAPQPRQYHLHLPIHLPDEASRNGATIQLQIEAVDNRELRPDLPDGSPQITRSSIMRIQFADPAKIAADSADRAQKLTKILQRMRQTQQQLLDASAEPGSMLKINAGQTDLRSQMIDAASQFDFDSQTQIIQRTLQTLAANPAHEAVDLSAAILTEPIPDQRATLAARLTDQQRIILSSLDSLLAILVPANPPATEPARGNTPLVSKPDAYHHLDDALAHYLDAQRKTLDQTASLAKLPTQNFDTEKKDELSKLQLTQDNLNTFVQQMISDFSKEGSQDLAHAHMLKELALIQRQVALAKDAMKTPDMQLAIPLELSAMGMGQEIKDALDKELSNAPDRMHFAAEDPLGGADVPMPKLPDHVQDLMGDLLADEQDLMNKLQDANTNWHDSASQNHSNRGADGNTADNSATGITGNVLPKNNEEDGRSPEGRNGKAQGEFVGDSAVGKGGRNTPTRLDFTPFQQGQVADQSAQSASGATGGGKLAGQGAAGLEGASPNLPPGLFDELQRLTEKQADLRNTAERLNLKNNLVRYDNFKLQDSIILMRQVENDLKAGRYDNALAVKDQLLDDLQTSRLLIGSQISVQEDTTPQPTNKMQQEIEDVMRGQLPPAWSQSLTDYYRQLSDQ
jgi:hypothetical protein